MYFVCVFKCSTARLRNYLYTCKCKNNHNHVHRAPFSDIERKKEVAKSKERRKEIHMFINY